MSRGQVGLALLAAALTACVPCTASTCCRDTLRSAAPGPAQDTAAVAATAQPPTASPSVEETYRAIAAQNLCPEGIGFLQDTWRFVGESRTPDFTDELAISGTRFTEHLSGRPDGLQVVQATLEGEMRCLEDNRVLVLVESVSPDGAFGNHAGDAYPCDVLTEVSGRSRRILLVCFFDWDLRPAVGREFEYERVPTR